MHKNKFCSIKVINVRVVLERNYCTSRLPSRTPPIQYFFLLHIPTSFSSCNCEKRFGGSDALQEGNIFDSQSGILTQIFIIRLVGRRHPKSDQWTDSACTCSAWWCVCASGSCKLICWSKNHTPTIIESSTSKWATSADLTLVLNRLSVRNHL